MKIEEEVLEIVKDIDKGVAQKAVEQGQFYEEMRRMGVAKKQSYAIPVDKRVPVAVAPR